MDHDRSDPRPERRPRRAVALHHDAAGDGAPRVVARGAGEVAERILAVAREHGVPVRRDPDLLELLSVSEVGDEIPTEVYASVARLIAFLWAMNEELGDGARSTAAGDGVDVGPVA